MTKAEQVAERIVAATGLQAINAGQLIAQILAEEFPVVDMKGSLAALRGKTVITSAGERLTIGEQPAGAPDEIMT